MYSLQSSIDAFSQLISEKIQNTRDERYHAQLKIKSENTRNISNQEDWRKQIHLIKYVNEY